MYLLNLIDLITINQVTCNRVVAAVAATDSGISGTSALVARLTIRPLVPLGNIAANATIACPAPGSAELILVAMRVILAIGVLCRESGR